MAKTVLERAKKAFFRKRYSDVITLLEPNIIQYRDSFPYYLFLGLACLHTGDSGGATSYLQRARAIKMRDPDLLAAQAALFLRRGETDQAVEYYLEALEYAPRHALSKKALNFIRKKGDRDVFLGLTETGAIRKFYPRPHKKRNVKTILLFVLCSVVVITGSFIVSHFFINNTIKQRADLSSFILQDVDKKSLVDLGGSYRYVLSEGQILKAYSNAQRFFQSYRDTEAQIEINKILHSNASLFIKQKTRLLMDYLSVPTFASLTNSISYKTVIEDPYLYQDCWVRWKGMATNLVTTEKQFSLDFLIGYDTRSTLEGIVPVRFDSVLPIQTTKPLEILGKISFENGSLYLAGSGIYQTAIPENR